MSLSFTESLRVGKKTYIFNNTLSFWWKSPVLSLLYCCFIHNIETSQTFGLPSWRYFLGNLQGVSCRYFVLFRCHRDGQSCLHLANGGASTPNKSILPPLPSPQPILLAFAMFPHFILFFPFHVLLEHDFLYFLYNRYFSFD